MIAVKDAASGKTSYVPIVAEQELPNEHLLHCIEQFVTGLFMRQLECMQTRKKLAKVAKSLLVHTVYPALLVAKRIPFLSREVSSLLAPVSFF